MWQDSYTVLKDAEFMEGLKGLAKFDRDQSKLVILDDRYGQECRRVADTRLTQ